ncbi:hypothetical protein ACHAWF_006970, partial [Thalassiosira exigua]
FLGRALEEHEFPSVRTIRNHITRLGIIDTHRLKERYEDVFRRKQPYGFQRFWYTTTDGSKHAKHDERQVVVRTGDQLPDKENKEYKEGFTIRPFFDCLSAGKAASKDWKGNSAHNIESILDNCSSLDVASMHNGNTSDNAARLEGEETSAGLKKHFIDEGRPELTEVYGVTRRFIIHMDPYHCCNLAAQHATEKGFGKTDQGNNRQVHHRQLLQTIHDIFICDPDFAQAIANKILEELEIEYKIKTIRERIQRWLCNGRNAKYILEGFDLDLPDGNFWVLWAKEYHQFVDSWKKLALEEIVRFFLMEEIVVGLQFEAELVDYFEVTSAWHAYPGELTSRPGFRMMEFPKLLREFIAPWWLLAVESPEERFPKTFARIEAMENEELAEMKKDQVIFGIEAGYNEIAKLYSRMFKAPMIFLSILDPEIGPTILRVLLAIASEEGVDVDAAETQYDDDDYGIELDEDLLWGKFLYAEDEEMPEEERVWYDWLSDDREAIAHWFRQLGWCRAVVLNDLKRLSQQTTPDPNRPIDSSTPLHNFFVTYPFLFVSLWAVFALLLSNSRIVEQAYGVMRACYDGQIRIDFWNAKMRHKMLEDYKMKEAHRRVIRAIMAAAKKGRVRRAAKHRDRKRTVAMLGRQLCEAANERMNEQISESIRKATQIGVIKKACTSSKEKELLIKKQNDAQDELALMRREKISLEKMAELANATQTDHDKTWNLREDRELTAHTDKILNKRRWNKVPAEDFKTALFHVFPVFESDAAWKASKSSIMKKTGEKYDLGQHIELIKKIAKVN